MTKKSASCDFKNCPMGCYSLGSLFVGIGIGALFTYPFFGTHPVKWGVSLIIIGIIFALYSKMKK